MHISDPKYGMWSLFVVCQLPNAPNWAQSTKYSIGYSKKLLCACAVWAWICHVKNSSLSVTLPTKLMLNGPSGFGVVSWDG